MRRQDESTDRDSYALVKEPHCLGHDEPRTLTIDDYREEQGLPEYDELARGWRQLILKKKSSGPTIGKPSKRSLQLFFMACYDLDRFRALRRERRLHDALRPARRRDAEDPRRRHRADAVRLPLPAPGAVRRGRRSRCRRETAARAPTRALEEKRRRLERDAAERLAREEEGGPTASDGPPATRRRAVSPVGARRATCPTGSSYNRPTPRATRARRFFSPARRPARSPDAHRDRRQARLQGRADPPQAGTLSTRSNVDISREFHFRHAQVDYHGVPIIAANMDTIGTFEMARALDAVPAVDRAAQALCGRRARRVLQGARAQVDRVLFDGHHARPTRRSSTA